MKQDCRTGLALFLCRCTADHGGTVWLKGPRKTALVRGLDSERGHTVIERLIVLLINAALAGAIIHYFGGFTNSTGEELERHRVRTAVAAYLAENGINAISSPFGITPQDQDCLEPYLNHDLQHQWVIDVDGSVACGSQLLFSTGFDNTDGLTVLAGEWEAKCGTLRPSDSWEEHKLTFAEASWDDFEMTVTATFEGDSGGYGIYYRCDSEAHATGYCVEYDADDRMFLVRRLQAGDEGAPVATASTGSGFPQDELDGVHAITIRVEGYHHVVTVNDTVALDFTDSAYTEGVSGLRTWNGPDVRFHHAIAADS